MATKKTTKTEAGKAKSNGKPAAGKTAKKTAGVKKVAKAVAAKVAGGPLARMKAVYGSKESLVGKLVDPLAGKDEDTDALKERLLRASNQQLLRLAKVVETVTKKYGGRDKLVATLGKALNKAKDADFLAKLETFSLPRLYDLAASHERRAKA